ncbi:MAG: sulfite exporter TauE/SafE family protein [Archaeoglobus sp.]|nr:sulfite exporter TauE/SafE family protein [Archaeoglobus sp.]
MDLTALWWFWILLLFIFTFLLGILAVMAGVGGGVLFTPIVGSFFPFHLDFVRGAGLFVALTGSLAAGPGLLRRGLANLRLAMPMALIASTSSIAGALVGLAMPTNIVQVLLGLAIIFIVFVMLRAKRAEFPVVEKPDKLSQVLKISGLYYEESSNELVEWKVHRTWQAMILFVLIGFIAGMFGLGAGWANVPVLNLVMGTPLKIAAGTSKFLLSITDTSAAFVYLTSGSVLALITIPSVLGIMLGSFIGVKLLAKANPRVVRLIVVAVLLFAGVRSLLKGLGIWV